MEFLMLSFKASIVPDPIITIKAEHSATSVQPEFVPLWALIIPQLGFKEDILKESKGVKASSSFLFMRFELLISPNSFTNISLTLYQFQLKSVMETDRENKFINFALFPL